MPIEPVGLAGDQMPLTDQLADPQGDSAPFKTLDLEAERGAQDRLRTEGGLALRKVPDGRGSGMLGLDRLGGKEKCGRAADRERTGRPHGSADPFGDFSKGLARRFAQRRADLMGGPRHGLGDEGFAVKAQFGGAGLPAFGQRGPILDGELGVTGVEGDLLLGGEAGRSGLGDLRLDLVCPGRKRLDDSRGHALDLECAMLAGCLGLIAELLELGAEGGVIELADCRVVFPDLTVPQRLPIALEVAGQIGDDGVNMPLGIERAARVVGKQGINEVAGLLRLAAATALVIAAFGILLLDELRHGRAHGRHVGIQDPPVA